VSEVVWEKHHDAKGQLMYETPFVNGKAHGIQKGYWSDGQLCWEDPFVNNQQHGISRWYNRDGTLRSETLWIRDKHRNDLLGDEHKLARLILLGEEV